MTLLSGNCHVFRCAQLRRLRREQPDGRHVFQTERKAPMTEAGVRKTLARIGEASALAFPAHPHMLRHAAGYKLASDGRDTRALQRKVGRPGSGWACIAGIDEDKSFWGRSRCLAFAVAIAYQNPA